MFDDPGLGVKDGVVRLIDPSEWCCQRIAIVLELGNQCFWGGFIIGKYKEIRKKAYLKSISISDVIDNNTSHYLGG